MIIVETERLILRCFHAFDGEAMDRVFGDGEVMSFGPGVQTPPWVRDWLRGCLENYYQKLGFGPWAVVEKNSRAVIGYNGFKVLCLPRLIALIDPQNVASIRVAEKAGMCYEREVMLEGYSHADHVYAVMNSGGG